MASVLEPSDLQEIQNRVLKLETRIGRWRTLSLIALAGVAIFGFFITTGRVNVGKIRAHTFVSGDFRVVDEKGVFRSSLAASSGGKAGLSVLDRNGSLRAALFVDPDTGTGLILRDEEGNVRVEMSELADSSVGLALVAENG